MVQQYYLEILKHMWYVELVIIVVLQMLMMLYLRPIFSYFLCFA